MFHTRHLSITPSNANTFVCIDTCSDSSSSRFNQFSFSNAQRNQFQANVSIHFRITRSYHLLSSANDLVNRKTTASAFHTTIDRRDTSKMPWFIEKKAADVQGNRVYATSETAKVIEIPVRGLLRAYVDTEASKTVGKTIISSLHERFRNLASRITGPVQEPFDTRAQYSLIENSNTDTAAEAIATDTRSRRLLKERAYQQRRAETLRTGQRKLDIEDLDRLSPSAGVGFDSRCKAYSDGAKLTLAAGRDDGQLQRYSESVQSFKVF